MIDIDEIVDRDHDGRDVAELVEIRLLSDYDIRTLTARGAGVGMAQRSLNLKTLRWFRCGGAVDLARPHPSAADSEDIERSRSVGAGTGPWRRLRRSERTASR